MIGALSLVSLFLGVALACSAERYPAHVAVLERGAGSLMIASLALFGSSLPFIP
jgi:hypothetical protein